VAEVCPDVFDTSEADAIIRLDIDHLALHRMMWVASGGRWCDKVVAQIGRFGTGSKAAPTGGLLCFWLGHGGM
jgi:hypothetical protein